MAVLLLAAQIILANPAQAQGNTPDLSFLEQRLQEFQQLIRQMQLIWKSRYPPPTLP
ncbi:MAG: hypothetical protein AB7H77_02610 [Bdellovibrionales bacterium]